MESSSKCVHSMVDTKEISCLQHGTFGQDPNGMEEKSFSQVHKGTAELVSVVWFSSHACYMHSPNHEVYVWFPFMAGIVSYVLFT